MVQQPLLKGRSISVATVGDFHGPSSSSGTMAAAATASITLKHFSSQLRSPRYFEPAPNLKTLAPYTPPPMLSPMRRGSGLFWNLSQSAFLEVTICWLLFVYLLSQNPTWKPYRDV